MYFLRHTWSRALLIETNEHLNFEFKIESSMAYVLNYNSYFKRLF